EGTTIPLPLADTMASVRVVDFLGTGTACLVWSSTDPADAGTALRYVDLLRSTKPHLLCSVVNGLGAQTTITYAPSTKFYLEDRLAGRLWATRLPFVVHTVVQVETTDAVAGTKVVVRYRYAHGFYDGVEREFHGFARVDSWDAESMSADHGAGSPPRAAGRPVHRGGGGSISAATTRGSRRAAPAPPPRRRGGAGASCAGTELPSGSPPSPFSSTCRRHTSPPFLRVGLSS